MLNTILLKFSKYEITLYITKFFIVEVVILDLPVIN